MRKRLSIPIALPLRQLLGISVLTGISAISLGRAEEAPASAPAPAAAQDAPRPMYIREYRIKGSSVVGGAEIGEVVYPFLGPGRLPSDVDHARAAVEKLYHDKGYEAVSVSIPVQQIRRGTVFLEVAENPVGRLRVRDARYTSPSALKALAPSLAEGKVVNFNDVKKELVAMNQLPGRQVTPDLHAGVTPGTVDIDLKVKDELPLHGSLELNNRYSQFTTPLRVSGALSYDNLWQEGHAAGFSFQLAPENIDDAKVFSAYYQWRLPNSDGWSLMLQGTKQDSNVSTLGSEAVVGRGDTIGLRALKTLPTGRDFTQSLSLGVDYKHSADGLLGAPAPLTYYPFSALYTASLKRGEGRTDFSGGVYFNVRGLGDSAAAFDAKRYQSEGSFIYFKGDLSHTHDLPGGLQLFGRIQGQASSQPLTSAEQFSGGGVGTARGYLEAELLGDDAVFGTVELRSPSLFAAGGADNDWRFYGFVDGGLLGLQQPLPGQISGGEMLSAGLGTRGRIFNHYNGSLDFGLPLVRSAIRDREALWTFRLWGDF